MRDNKQIQPLSWFHLMILSEQLSDLASCNSDYTTVLSTWCWKRLSLLNVSSRRCSKSLTIFHGIYERHGPQVKFVIACRHVPYLCMLNFDVVRTFFFKAHYMLFTQYSYNIWKVREKQTLIFVNFLLDGVVPNLQLASSSLVRNNLKIWHFNSTHCIIKSCWL